MKIVLSSGHGLFVRGARGIIDEVDEARRVTNRVAEILRTAGVGVSTFHDDTSRNVSNNIGAIVRHHNSQTRDLDVSVHFNSFQPATDFVQMDGWRRVDRPVGVEVLYRTGNSHTRQIAGEAARAISGASGLLLRHMSRDVPGTVPRTDLGFLNNTSAPAILLEVCFVNSSVDVELYRQGFEEICQAIATAVSGRVITTVELPTASLPAASVPVVSLPAANPPVVSPPAASPPAQPAQTPQPSSWAREAWDWGINLGLTDGTNPQGTPTREQMVTLLHRYHRATG